VIICISILIVSVSGCIDNDEKEKEEVYILEAVISVNKNVVWIVYPDEKSETITFDASSSKGDIVEYKWDFGDNETGEGVLVTHRYTQADTYQVKLKITDTNGKDNLKQLNFVYVNYKAEYEGNITKDEKEKSYFFPLKGSAKSATITLQYSSNYVDHPSPIPDKPNTNNLDLYIYYNASDDSEVKNSSTPLDTKATGTIKEVVELSRNDLLYNLTGMRASVKWADDCPPSDNPIDYTLLIEVYYN